ncbi:hypothetical protein [Cellulomonas biazotea]|uniref:Secreted protein n=1 Tax=Cellulomonas biazotea TaxID=1709 RepID=A0A402DRW5_9CELL|nr:hypothetical protein [Cellulomonas biazotea]GCE76816.1 hypothetical protein CBZ_18720 [Cellulomonas biazotea]
MSRIATSLAATAIAGAALALLAAPASAKSPVDPFLHNPDNWENGVYTCTKVEYVDGTKSYVVPDGVAFVVVKTGTVYTVVDHDPYGTTHWFAKDISFVISCAPDGGTES